MSTQSIPTSSGVSTAKMPAVTADKKRSIPVTVKMSEDDLAFLEKAIKRHWPGAPITRSTMVLALAKLGAESILKNGGKR